MALASLKGAQKLHQSMTVSSELYFSRKMHKTQEQVTDIQD